MLKVFCICATLDPVEMMDNDRSVSCLYNNFTRKQNPGTKYNITALFQLNSFLAAPQLLFTEHHVRGQTCQWHWSYSFNTLPPPWPKMESVDHTMIGYCCMLYVGCWINGQWPMVNFDLGEISFLHCCIAGPWTFNSPFLPGGDPGRREPALPCDP